MGLKGKVGKGPELTQKKVMQQLKYSAFFLPYI
jgi:hypothetical protein